MKKPKGLLHPYFGAECRTAPWAAALLTPCLPSGMVLNEPETSLHPDPLSAPARLITRASQRSQVCVVSHAGRLIAALNEHPPCHAIALEKDLGQTQIVGQGMLG